MARLLHVWEQGGQLSHLNNIDTIARVADDEGHEQAVALRELQRAHRFFSGLRLQYYQAPFKQGVLVPSPDVLIPSLPLDGIGGLVLSFAWPTGLPPDVTTWHQYWIPDPGAPAGFAASNGVEAAAP